MSELADLIEKTSSPADLAVVLLAGTAGLVIDAGLNVIGFLSPATTAFAFAGAALGLKKSAEAARAHRQARRAQPRDPASRARALMEEFEHIGMNDRAKEIKNDIRLMELGIVTESDLQVQVEAAVVELREATTVRQLLGKELP
jgi:hypothetical protein